MTRKEAIKRLKNIWIRDGLQEDYDALYMAINSLEKDEKYAEFRERFQKAMIKENMFSINSRDFDDSFFDAAESEDKE